MKRKAKKSKAKKSKAEGTKNINIEIKNVVKQVQNEKYDYVQYQKNPKRNLEFGSYSRFQNPSVSYASTPLANFPSLSSIVSAPAQSQLSSRPPQYRQDVLQVETNPLDIEQSRSSSVLIKPQPIIAPLGFSSYNPRVHELLRPINLAPELRSTSLEDIERKYQDESELLVSRAMDQDTRDIDFYLREPTLPPTPDFRRIRSGTITPATPPILESEIPNEPTYHRKAFSNPSVSESGGNPNRAGRPSHNQPVIIPSNPNLKSAGLARGGSIFY